MKTYIVLFLIVMLTNLFNTETLYSQDSDFRHIRLFQSFFTDARVSESPYISGFFSAQDIGGDVFTIDISGGAPVTSQIEVESRIAALFVNPGFAGSRQGISDWLITGRYLFDFEKVHAAAGAQFTLPVGSEKVGAGNFNYGFYSAARYEISKRFLLTGNLQLNFVKIPFLTFSGGFFSVQESRETTVGTGFGGMIDVGSNLFFVGEFAYESKTDFSVISTGIDYFINRKGNIRINAIFGLDDGAPDIGGSFGLLVPF